MSRVRTSAIETARAPLSDRPLAVDGGFDAVTDGDGRLSAGARATPLRARRAYHSRSSANTSGGTEQPQGPTEPVWGPVATENSTGSPQRGHAGNGESSSSLGSRSGLTGRALRFVSRPNADSRLVVACDSIVVRDVYIPTECTQSWLSKPRGLEATSRVIPAPGAFRRMPPATDGVWLPF